MGLDIRTARRAGLLHDILVKQLIMKEKALISSWVQNYVENTTVFLIVINAVESHHGDAVLYP